MKPELGISRRYYSIDAQGVSNGHTRHILTKVSSVPLSAVPFFSPALDCQTSGLPTKATLLR